MGNSRFSDGFLLGALVGGAAVFLLGTKKGNKILSSVTEEGLDGLTDFIDNLQEEKEGLAPEPKVPSKEEDVLGLEEKIELETPKTNGVVHKAPAKRFFRRSKA